MHDEFSKKGSIFYLVHADVAVLSVVIREDDAHRVFALLALQQDGITAEELELLHLGLAQAHHAVVVVGGIVDNKAVGRLLLVLQLRDGE